MITITACVIADRTGIVNLRPRVYSHKDDVRMSNAMNTIAIYASVQPTDLGCLSLSHAPVPPKARCRCTCIMQYLPFIDNILLWIRL